MVIISLEERETMCAGYWSHWEWSPIERGKKGGLTTPKAFFAYFSILSKTSQDLPCPRKGDVTKIQSPVTRWKDCHQRFDQVGHPGVGTVSSYELWQQSINFIFHLSVVKCHNYVGFCSKLGREGKQNKNKQKNPSNQLPFPERLELEKPGQEHWPVSKHRLCWYIQHYHVKFLTLINQGHEQTSPFKNFMKETAVHFSLWTLSLRIQMQLGSCKFFLTVAFWPEQLVQFSVICCLHQDKGRIFFNTFQFVNPKRMQRLLGQNETEASIGDGHII